VTRWLTSRTSSPRFRTENGRDGARGCRGRRDRPEVAYDPELAARLDDLLHRTCHLARALIGADQAASEVDLDGDVHAARKCFNLCERYERWCDYYMTNPLPSLSPVLHDIHVSLVSAEAASLGVAEFWSGDRLIGFTRIADGDFTLRIGPGRDGVVLGARALAEALAEATACSPSTEHTSERHAMKIVVIGGSGLIASKLVDKLRQDGHDPLAASPDSGVDTITGEGLAEALEGAQVVVDVANAPAWDDRPCSTSSGPPPATCSPRNRPPGWATT
jgi:hypothetical protein